MKCLACKKVTDLHMKPGTDCVRNLSCDLFQVSVRREPFQDLSLPIPGLYTLLLPSHFSPSSLIPSIPSSPPSPYTHTQLLSDSTIAISFLLCSYFYSSSPSSSSSSPCPLPPPPSFPPLPPPPPPSFSSSPSPPPPPPLSSLFSSPSSSSSSYSCSSSPGRKEMAKFNQKSDGHVERKQDPSTLSRGFCTVWSFVTALTKDLFVGPPTDIRDCLNAFFDASELKGIDVCVVICIG